MTRRCTSRAATARGSKTFAPCRPAIPPSRFSEWFTLHPFNTDTTAPVPTFPFQLLDQFRNALIGLRDEHDLASRQQTTSDGKPAKNGDAPALPLEAKEGTAAAAPPKSRAWCTPPRPALRPAVPASTLAPLPGIKKKSRRHSKCSGVPLKERQGPHHYIQEIAEEPIRHILQRRPSLPTLRSGLRTSRTQSTRSNRQQRAIRRKRRGRNRLLAIFICSCLCKITSNVNRTFQLVRSKCNPILFPPLGGNSPRRSTRGNSALTRPRYCRGSSPANCRP